MIIWSGNRKSWTIRHLSTLPYWPFVYIFEHKSFSQFALNQYETQRLRNKLYDLETVNL